MGDPVNIFELWQIELLMSLQKRIRTTAVGRNPPGDRKVSLNKTTAIEMDSTKLFNRDLCFDRGYMVNEQTSQTLAKHKGPRIILRRISKKYPSSVIACKKLTTK